MAAGMGGVALSGESFATGRRPNLAGRGNEETRLEHALRVRIRAAEHSRSRGLAELQTNGDEEELPVGVASFSKALPHDELGQVDPEAFALLLRALKTGENEDFESIPLGGYVKLANPQAALAFDLVGPDGCQVGLRPPPRLASPELAGEMVELYWRALARDVPFEEYRYHPIIRRAAADLSELSALSAPKEAGRVTGDTIFREASAGAVVGPFISQFLWRAVPLSPVWTEQRLRTAMPGVDYLSDYESWLGIQNGVVGEATRFDDQPRFMRSGRDLAEYVHRDFTYQASLGACLAALKMGTLSDGGNPYKHSRTQSGFATFGPSYLFYLLAVVTQVALKACWFQKWMVHRRLRPEMLGGRVENHLRRRAGYPLHRDLFEAQGLEEVRKRQGTALLSQAYPEGCPTHPSYPAGHAVIAGACATVLKACLDESHEIPDPVVATGDGRSLRPYQGPTLTVGGELDKLASNIAFGRDFAGVHYRSDGHEGMKLGEAIAIAVLEEMRLTGNEIFTGFSLRRFDGTRVSVG